MVPMDLMGKWRMVVKDQGSRYSVESNLLNFHKEFVSYDDDEETELSLWTNNSSVAQRSWEGISRRRTEGDTSLVIHRTLQTSPIGWVVRVTDGTCSAGNDQAPDSDSQPRCIIEHQEHLGLEPS